MNGMTLTPGETADLADLVTGYRDAVATDGEANEAAQRVTEWVEAHLVRGGHLEGR